MKKLLLVLSALMLTSAVFAQTVSSPVDKLGIQMKGAIKTGDDVDITIMLTNNTQKDATINLVGGQYQTGMSGSIAYDNEGNIYELGDVLVSVGRKALTEQYCGVSVPSGVSVKCHVRIRNFAADAKELTKVKVCLLCPELEINNTGVCFELNNVKL